tara:strand:- start:67 stop:189 length:123 start_codon:yes stop_codon:yes gene_type:complete
MAVPHLVRVRDRVGVRDRVRDRVVDGCAAQPVRAQHLVLA